MAGSYTILGTSALSVTIALTDCVSKPGKSSESLVTDGGHFGLKMEESDPRKNVKLIIAGVVFIAALITAWFMVGGSSPAEIAAKQIYICSETNRTFEHKAVEGEIEPIMSPHSKKKTGYLAEKCYWRKMPDGSYKAKKNPTYVLLKRRVDWESTEKTYCPDCEREVVGHNPMPSPEEMQAAD